MRTVYFDLGMGAAGDMISAALLELTEDRENSLRKLNEAGLPGIVYKIEDMEKCGILAAKLNVWIDGEMEEPADDAAPEVSAQHFPHHSMPEEMHPGHHDSAKEHADSQHNDSDHHHHHHHHAHTGMKEIEAIISGLNVSDKVRSDIRAVYALIGAAESKVHGVTMDQIHFHEVGSMDAVADITAACILMEELHPERILASPIQVGSGTVRCAHGILPVPAPATAEILTGIPIYSTDIKGELCTPTGAALVKHFVQEFTELPPMVVRKTGYGMGKKNFTRLNCVRSFLGESDGTRDTILHLSCNIDDMTGEDLGFASDMLMKAGAKDVYTIPITMKKSRPAVMLNVMCDPKDRETIIREIFLHTSTIGIRETRMDRYILNRSEVTEETPFGPVRKKACSGYGITKEKWEYDDLARIAREKGISLEKVRDSLQGAGKEKEI